MVGGRLEPLLQQQLRDLRSGFLQGDVDDRGTGLPSFQSFDEEGVPLVGANGRDREIQVGAIESGDVRIFRLDIEGGADVLDD